MPVPGVGAGALRSVPAAAVAPGPAEVCEAGRLSLRGTWGTHMARVL